MTDIPSLEEKIAHLTRMVEDLSDVVAGHSRTIDRLSYRVLQLVEREAEREVASGTEIPLADQRPPHW